EREGAAATTDEALDEDGAGELVLAVDLHRITPADAVGAALAEGEGAVEVPLDVVEEVEGAVHGVHVREGVLLPVGGLVPVRVVALDLDGDLHGRWQMRMADGGGSPSAIRHPQYFRSFGWKRVMTTSLWSSS